MPFHLFKPTTWFSRSRNSRNAKAADAKKLQKKSLRKKSIRCDIRDEHEIKEFLSPRPKQSAVELNSTAKPPLQRKDSETSAIFASHVEWNAMPPVIHTVPNRNGIIQPTLPNIVLQQPALLKESHRSSVPIRESRPESVEGYRIASTTSRAQPAPVSRVLTRRPLPGATSPAAGAQTGSSQIDNTAQREREIIDRMRALSEDLKAIMSGEIIPITAQEQLQIRAQIRALEREHKALRFHRHGMTEAPRLSGSAQSGDTDKSDSSCTNSSDPSSESVAVIDYAIVAQYQARPLPDTPKIIAVRASVPSALATMQPCLRQYDNRVSPEKPVGKVHTSDHSFIESKSLLSEAFARTAPSLQSFSPSNLTAYSAPGRLEYSFDDDLSSSVEMPELPRSLHLQQDEYAFTSDDLSWIELNENQSDPADPSELNKGELEIGREDSPTLPSIFDPSFPSLLPSPLRINKGSGTDSWETISDPPEGEGTDQSISDRASTSSHLRLWTKAAAALNIF